MAKNTFCHVEFQCSDLDQSRKFYEGLFEWTFRDFGGDMIVFGVGDQHLGGLQKSDNIIPGNSPSVWIEVDSIEDYLAKAKALGGEILSDKSPVPSVGFSAIITDPDANAVGLVQFDRS